MKNVCFVGCGAIAKKHAKTLHGQVGMYFYSRTRESAQKMCNQFQALGVFSSYTDVLLSDNVDAVILCSPPEAHANQIIQALEKGKSVLVEKPMVISLQELDDVMCASDQCPDQFVMVAENYHYKPLVRDLQKIIASQTIGKIQEIYIRKVFKQSSNGWKSNYGALFEGGIHFVALCNSLLGRQAPQTIRSLFPGTKKPERTSCTELSYDKGIKAKIDYSWEKRAFFQGVFQHSFIKGTQGRVIFESNGLYMKSPEGLQVGQLKDLGGQEEMMRDFLQCLSDSSKKPSYDYHQAALDLRIVFQAYHQQDQSVKIPTKQ